MPFPRPDAIWRGDICGVAEQTQICWYLHLSQQLGRQREGRSLVCPASIQLTSGNIFCPPGSSYDPLRYTPLHCSSSLLATSQLPQSYWLPRDIHQEVGLPTYNPHTSALHWTEDTFFLAGFKWGWHFNGTAWIPSASLGWCLSYKFQHKREKILVAAIRVS